MWPRCSALGQRQVALQLVQVGGDDSPRHGLRPGLRAGGEHAGQATLNGQQKAPGSGSAAARLFDAPGWQLFPQRFFGRPVKQIALARIQQSETEHPAIYAGFCFAQMF
jgi:hypothetical protein